MSPPMDPMTTDYHSRPEVSASQLKAALTRTPRQYWRQYGPERVPLVPTDAMRQGSLVDCLCTRADQFSDLYAVMPEGLNRTTKAGKEAYAELVATGKEIIPASWHRIATAIRAALLEDPIIGPLLSHASQQYYVWHDAEHGIDCRYMPDIEAPGLLLDLKKTASPSPAGFAAQVWNMAYDLQLAHYSLGHAARFGMTPARVGFIAYDWNESPDFGLYWLPADWLLIGMERRMQAIERVKAAEAVDYHPSHGVQTLALPRWATIGGTTQPTDSEEF